MMLPSTALILVETGVLAGQPAEPFFRPAEEVAAFQCLADQERREAVVLSSYETGNALPAWAPVFVVVGHGPESAKIAELLPRISAFYGSGTSAQTKLALLEELGVNYVFWGPHERTLGDWDPGTADFLSPYCQVGPYRILATR